VKQPINIGQNVLDELAAGADDLCNWLEQEVSGVNEPNEGGKLRIPSQFTVIATIALIYGFPILLDSYLPNSACWGGGCLVI
jgi:hypothetical protein